MVRLVVACGGGIFTTTVVTDKIKEILRENKIQGTITPHKITEIAQITGEDLIVVTGKTSATNKAGIPVIVGMALFTGMGEEEFTEELLDRIREIERSR
jgi:Phosphotransferase system, galactitol-specific IIB component